MRDGSVRTWMNFKNPDVVRAAGPIDPEVGLLLVRSAEDDKPLGLFTNFALHLDTVGGTQVERRLPVLRRAGAAEVAGARADFDLWQRLLRRHQSHRSRVGGTEIGPISSADRWQRRSSRRWPACARSTSPILRVRTTTVRLPLPEISAADVKQADNVAQGGSKQVKRSIFFRARGGLQDGHARRPAQPAAVQPSGRLSQNGPVAHAGRRRRFAASRRARHLPGKGRWPSSVCRARCSSTWAWRSSAARRSARRWWSSLSNCVETLYIPTRAAYAGGGYEVINSAVQPGSGEMLVEAALRLLRDVPHRTRPASECRRIEIPAGSCEFLCDTSACAFDNVGLRRIACLECAVLRTNAADPRPRAAVVKSPVSPRESLALLQACRSASQGRVGGRRTASGRPSRDRIRRVGTDVGRRDGGLSERPEAGPAASVARAAARRPGWRRILRDGAHFPRSSSVCDGHPTVARRRDRDPVGTRRVDEGYRRRREGRRRRDLVHRLLRSKTRSCGRTIRRLPRTIRVYIANGLRGGNVIARRSEWSSARQTRVDQRPRFCL